MKTKVKHVIIFDIVVLAIVAVALALSMIWSRSIELATGLLYAVPESQADPDEIVVLSKNGARVATGELTVNFLDVGQGDCAVIEFPDGKTMIVDGGEDNSKTETAIRTFVESELDPDFKYFDYAVLTHADSDHCGSLDYALENYPARVVYRPNVEARKNSKYPDFKDPAGDALTSDAGYKATNVYIEAVQAMHAKNADFTPVVHITDPSNPELDITGGTGDDMYSFTFYSPISRNYTGTGQWNNYSPIMILEYRGFKYAMSGDAEEKNLGEFVARVASARTDGVTDKYDVFTDDYCVNVIKAGHHGSRNATTLAYLEAITCPEQAGDVYCVISCGAGNKYNHPHSEAIDRYKQIGVKQDNILRTDEKSTIVMSVRADESGEYALYYGDTQSSAKPAEPVTKVYVYMKAGGIKLTWAVVAWSGYAVLVVLAAVHIAVTVVFDGEKPSAGGKTKRSANKGGGKK